MSSSDLHAPRIYEIMTKFAADELPKPPLVTRDSQTKKLNVQYVKRKPVPAVVNTRNPFSRLYAAWSDKFNFKSSFLKQEKPIERLKWIYDAVEELEEENFTKPPGYVNSFDAFAKYISISTTATQNHHWRSLYWSCRPCHMKYEYITQIENAEAESNFVFEALKFNTHLPADHSSSSLKSKVKTKKKLTTSERYASIPIKTMIDIYRQYYLDFVVFGFSADSVLEVINPNRASSARHRFSIRGNQEARKHLQFGIEQQKMTDPDEQYNNCDNLNISSIKQIP